MAKPDSTFVAKKNRGKRSVSTSGSPQKLSARPQTGEQAIAPRPQPARALVHAREFQEWFGVFQVTWASMELVTDYAIGKFLELPAEATHLITSGLMFGRKARLLG